MTVLHPVQTIKDWPKDDQPQEKLRHQGLTVLSDAELLALLLRTGHAATGQNALDLARALLIRFGGLCHLAGREVCEFCVVPGIGPVKAAQILAAIELGKRLDTPDPDRIAFGSSTEVANYFIPRMRDLKKEVFKVLLLDARNKLIKEVTVSEGSLTASLAHPRETFRAAILECAASVIVVHNHPSSCVEPSQEDLAITKQLMDAGKLIDIRVLDHIIVGHRTFTSFASKGLI